MKINYKGCLAPRDWEYVCEDCCGRSVINHSVNVDMHSFTCDWCEGKLLRYINKAPLLDADYHQDHLTRNIGWDR